MEQTKGTLSPKSAQLNASSHKAHEQGTVRDYPPAVCPWHLLSEMLTGKTEIPFLAITANSLILLLWGVQQKAALSTEQMIRWLSQQRVRVLVPTELSIYPLLPRDHKCPFCASPSVLKWLLPPHTPPDPLPGCLSLWTKVPAIPPSTLPQPLQSCSWLCAATARG